MSSSTWQDCYKTLRQNILVRQYLTSLSYLLSKIILSSSTWQVCFTYYQITILSSSNWQDCYKTLRQNIIVRQYLTSLSYLLSKITLSSSTWQVCFTYYQSCQVVTDKPIKTFNKKWTCQAVLDKPVLLTIKNILVKQYLTRLFYLLSKIILSK